MNKINDSDKFLAQDKLYYFPYHYLPTKIAKDIIKPFRVYYWLYDYMLMIDFIKLKIVNLPSSNILDFGCGDGRLLFELKSETKNKYFGYDISKQANMLFNAFNPEVKLINEQNNLNNYNDFFDVITFSEVIEHNPENELSINISVIHSILKKNGLLIITAPHENTPVRKKHYRHYNFNSLAENFPDNKYEIIEKKFLFKKENYFSILLRKFFFNRFFLVNSNLLHKMYYKFKKKFFFTEEKKSQTILLILRKK